MKILSTILLVSSVMFSAVAYSSSEEDEVLSFYRFRSRPIDFIARATAVCCNLKNVDIDFSFTHLTDDDLDVIFNALVERKKEANRRHEEYGLHLLNLSGSSITEEGFLKFLRNLQHGKKEDEGSIIYPEVRETIIKIGLSLTEEFVEAMQKVAPSTFAGGIQILE